MAERRNPTARTRRDDDPRKIPVDEMITGQVLQEIIESNDLKRVIIFWARIIAGLCVCIIVFCAALQIQIDRRNDQINQVEKTVVRTERVACGFSRLIPDDRRGDIFNDCDKFNPTTTTTEP